MNVDMKGIELALSESPVTRKYSTYAVGLQPQSTKQAFQLGHVADKVPYGHVSL